MASSISSPRSTSNTHSDVPALTDFPSEILENVVELLAEDADGLYETTSSIVSNLALTCRVFGELCRRRIFHSVELYGDGHYSQKNGLLSTLDRCPEVRPMVKNAFIDLPSVATRAFGVSDLARVVSRLTAVEVLTLYGGDELMVGSEPLKSLGKLFSAALVKLSLQNADLPTTIMASCPNLKKLELEDARLYTPTGANGGR